MMMHARRTMLAVALLAGCGSGDSALGTPSVDTLPSGVVVVKNSRPTRWADSAHAWHFTQVAGITGTMDTTSPLINPGGAVLDPLGRIVVPERNPPSVRIFERSGRLVRSFGRDGSGPGEFRSPSIVAFGPYIAVHDAGLARLELFDSTGALLREFPAPCCYYYSISVDDSNRVYMRTSPGSDSTKSSAFVRMNVATGAADTILLDRLGTEPMWRLSSGDGSIGYGVPYAAHEVLGFTREGHVLHGWSSKYQWVELNAHGDTIRIVSTDWTPVERPLAIRRARFDTLVKRAARTFGEEAVLRAFNFSDIPANAEPLGSLESDAAGRTWVRVFDGDTLHSAFDVYDSTGAWLGRLTTPWRANEFVQYWGRSEVLTQSETPDGLPTIGVWRLDTGNHQ